MTLPTYPSELSLPFSLDARSAAPILEVDVEFAPDLAVVRLVGELDIGSEHLLTDAISCVAARTAGPLDQVILDLSGVTFCDVAGLRAIEGSAFALSRAGRTLTVRHPSRAVLRLVALSREPGLSSMPRRSAEVVARQVGVVGPALGRH